MVFLAIDFAFLAMDGSLMFHKRLVYAIHSAFGWQETHLSGRIYNTIVRVHAIIGALFVFTAGIIFASPQGF